MCLVHLKYTNNVRHHFSRIDKLYKSIPETKSKKSVKVKRKIRPNKDDGSLVHSGASVALV